jgi:hypothetical protein
MRGLGAQLSDLDMCALEYLTVMQAKVGKGV